MTKEVENVLKLDNLKKYRYYLKKIADYEEVWSLKDDEGWASLGMNDEFFSLYGPRQSLQRFVFLVIGKGIGVRLLKLTNFCRIGFQG